MSRTTALRLLAAQTVLLIAVLWIGAYFARDEFQLATEGEEEKVPTLSHVSDEAAGTPLIRLSEAARRNVDLGTARPEPGRRAAARELRLQVLDPQPLIALRGQWRTARAAVTEAEAAVTAARAERARTQALHDDERQASGRALDAAVAAAAQAEARLAAAQAALRSQVEGARAAWGPRAGVWITAPEGSPGAAALQRLAEGREVLLRAAWPSEQAVPDGAHLKLRPPGADGAAQPATVRAEALGAAPAPAGSEAPAGLRYLLYRAPGAGLSPAQQLGGRLALPGEPVAGVYVPASALVWQAGQPWVYALTDEAPADAASAASASASASADAASAPAPAAGPARGRDRGPGGDDDDDAGPSAAPPASQGPVQGFRRLALPGAEREPGPGGRWFLPGFDPGREVVVRGAQVLLSEEQKALILNENDD